MTVHQKPAPQTTGTWLSAPLFPLGGERNLTAHLSSCSWQEVLDNDGFAQGWEWSFHDTPHEGLYQGRRDAAAFFHLIQDLQGHQELGYQGAALFQMKQAYHGHSSDQT